MAERDGEIAGLNKAITARDGEIAGLNQAIAERDGEIAGLNQAIAERDGEIAGLNQAMAERDGEIAGLNQAIAERDGQITLLNHALVESDLQLEVKNTSINELLNSNSWRITKPLRFLSRPLKLGKRVQTAFNREVRLIRHSSLFDATFYRDCYPDVRESKIDPARHYCLFGWKEHRDPSLSFSTHRYLALNPDVASAGINPLFHYIKYGKIEGRPNPLHNNLQITQENTAANNVEPTAIITEVDKDLSVQECHDTFVVDYDCVDGNEITNQRVEIEIKDIINSGLFDTEYYMSMYPDFNLVSEDCIRHYCEIGWRQGLNPSDDFDTNTYLESYNDIKNAGLNPFWHYVVAGREESRQATPDSNNKYEDDIYFGTINRDVQLISYYKNPDWSAVQQIRTTSNGMDQMLIPHGSVSFYSTSGACVFEQQAQMAKRHGISAWCFYLDLSQNSSSDESLLAFISNKNIDLDFILEVDLRTTKLDESQAHLIKQAISDKRYLHLDNRPAVIIILPHDEYASNEVLSDFYSIVGVSEDLYKIVRIDAPIEKNYAFVRKNKLDAILDFPLSLLGEVGSFKPFQVSGTKSVPYSVVVSQAISRMKGYEECATPCYRTVTLGRDETSLKQDESLRYTRFSLAEYRRWLDAAIKDTKAKQVKNQRLLFINAWNDWELGATLEADKLTGYSKLNETSRALLGFPVGLALPKVSVIVTNYNHEKYLRRRLDSIYQQTYKNIEVFLLDDCSTDNSREVLKEYAERFPDITTLLFNQKNSGGVFRQWAKGLQAATGDLVWIAESDDYCDDNFLEKLVRCFDDEAVMLAYSKVEFVQADESVIPDEFFNYTRGLVCRDQWKQSYVKTAHQEVSEALGIINTIPNASGTIFRRPVNMPLLEDESWLSMRVVGDWILYLHQLRGGKIAYSVETTNYFRRYENSTAASAYKKEAFYRELGMASRAVVRLYNVPENVIEKAFERSKELYEHFCGTATEEFSRWFDKAAIIDERRLRTPNIMVSTMAFHPGGAEILPIRMANEFKRQGYSVMLLSTGLSKREEGIRNLLRRDIPVVETSDVKLTRRLICEFGIEVLNSHQWHVQKYPTHVHDVFSELKVHVASLHGMIEHGDAFGVTAEQLSVADKHVTTWVYTADKNLGPFIEYDLYDNNSAKFVKLPNGMQPPVIEAVPRSNLGIPDEAFVLCCVSRAIPDKGWLEAIAAVSLARDISGKDIRLILVGNGPVYDDYCRTGIPSFVYLAGFSENSVGYYATADMGIMLTKFKSESFPLTIVDCLFAGKPYIATGVGEIKNMLTTDDGMAGQVIELDDWEVPVSQVAQVIATYATDSEALRLAEAMVEKAANRYRIDVVVEQYASLFEKSRGNE
ncbi:glycosyltransferase [Aeromonas enteropelogenes]|uniref:glycosyltransferase n=1 Tax=Aeromonas enteropelogenes TaxID=29489 RepID=UPI003BA06F70